jgi:mannose-6-phosphate isomerase
VAEHIPFDRPLLLRPSLRPLVWGGQRLFERYGKGRAGQQIAESWEFSDRSDGSASVLWGGDGATPAYRPLHSLTRDEAVSLYGAGILQNDQDKKDRRDRHNLPVLFKLIDATARLSLQVHPGRQDLDRVSVEGAESKEEAWLVLAAEPGAKIFLGLRPRVRREDLRRALGDGRVEELLHAFEVRAGDVFHVRPGVFHAIGAGVLLAEVQQSSDTTYRAWDWGRLDDDGLPRALHVEQALAVGRFDEARVPERRRDGRGELPTSDEDLLLGDGFRMDWRQVAPGGLLDPERDRTRFAVYCLLAAGGDVSLRSSSSGARELPLALGESVLLPPAADPPQISAGAGFLKVSSVV